MAKIYGSESHYIIKNERVNRKVSTGSLLVVTFISGFTSAFVVDFFGKELDPLVKIIVFVLVLGIFFFVIWKLLVIYSKTERKADNFQQGFEGEDLVFKELVKLSDEYVVFRDVVLNKGNIDFVVVSSSIVFCIEVKSHAGKISFNGNDLIRNGYLFKEKNFINQAWLEGKDVKEFLQYKLGQSIPVVPVLVFSNPKSWVENNPMVPVKFGVHLLHMRMLLKFITQPRQSSARINIPAIISFFLPYIKHQNRP